MMFVVVHQAGLEFLFLLVGQFDSDLEPLRRRFFTCSYKIVPSAEKYSNAAKIHSRAQYSDKLLLLFPVVCINGNFLKPSRLDP